MILRGKKDEEVEAQIIYSKKRRVKIIRSIEKSKENFNKKDKFKRDVIMDYASFGSKVYAPLTRDGQNPDRNPFKLQYVSDYLTSYEGLSYLETQVTQDQLLEKLDIDVISKEYNNKLRKGEKVHVKAIDDAFASIKNQEKKLLEEKLSLEKKADESKNKVEKPKVTEKKAEDFEEIILFQRLLRGRKEQNLMHEGKSKRAELIKELRSADYYKQAGASEEEHKLMDNYVEKLMNGVVDAIQGQNISQTLDFLSKELVRKREEMKINAIVNKAEDERRRREAEEMGRRQAEDLLRDRQEVMYKELLNVNQGTMDSYLNSIFAGTVNNVSKKQVMREIEIKAVKLNKIVDKLENEFISDDVTVRDLVSSFIIPEINRKKVEDISENI